MKSKLSLIATLFAISSIANGAIVAQWNFNSASPGDGNTATGLATPSTGTGTLTTIGSVTSSFASGAASGGSSDPATTDNSGFQTTAYPAATVGNKTAGIQVNTSTVGLNDIIISWDQRHSNTAANTIRFQYTIDASAPAPLWVDGPQFTSGTGDTWFNGRTADLSAVPAVNNNANFAFRVVTEFDPVAGEYLPSNSSSNYAGGTLRFDMITVNAIPEPTSALLGGLGMLALLRRRR